MAIPLRAAALLSTLLVSTPASAQEPPRPGEIRLPSPTSRLATPAERRGFAERAGWREFAARHGAWNVVWNAATGSPHRAFGRPIPLPGFADDAPAVTRAVRGFVAANAGVFGTPELELVRAIRVRGAWYVTFREVVDGVPVLFADWEFRVGANGRLFAFGADAPGGLPVVAGPRLPSPVARQAARLGLAFDPARDRIEGGESLALLPVAGERGTEYRRVIEARVVTADPPHDWYTLVDAATGEVLLRHDRVRHDIGGHVTADVHPLLPTDPLAARDLPHLRVTVGATGVNTGLTGLYSAPAAGTVTVSAGLLGLYCDVRRSDGVANAAFSAPATDPATVDIPWTTGNAHDAERDAYYHVNVVHDFVKGIDPGLARMDYAIRTNVNINNTCNAFFQPADSSINFFRAGGSCPNTATMPDVVYHEYGHAVNDKQYQQAGALSGMFNGALHEGMADVLAALLQDTPNAGKGFFGPGTILRTIDNTLRWPQDASGDPHITGLILGGAFWDLRQSAGLAVARDLSHFARYGTPDDFDDGVAMSEYFVETLIADDDDADLSNGTPHFADVVAAFNAHGIGTGFFIAIEHTPLADQPTSGPYAVRDTVRWTGPFGGLAGAPVMHWSTDGVTYTPVTMTPAGDPDAWVADIPPQSGAVVRYYLGAQDQFGETVTSPPFAPSQGTHRFVAGAATTLASYDMEGEGPAGWFAGSTFDNATTGLWERTDPNGTYVGAAIEVQPENDHSGQAGFLCWVTGNALPGAAAGVNDVDGGRTTLNTPVFDATAGGLVNPAISYWRWYTNNLGAAPGSDTWLVEVTNDGENWVVVENTTASANSWTRIVFPIAEYVTPTATMQMRFIAEDAGSGSLVEAAVDDFTLLAFTPGAAAVEPVKGSGARVALSAPWPSPSSGPITIQYSMPASGDVSLRVYDVRGRAVRTLVTGAREAGTHTALWDGRDESGHTVTAGVYFARLIAGGGVATRRLVRSR
jgi:hypothetical protein